MEIKDMIEEETHYFCKKCNCRYNIKESAINCYKSHPKITKIIDQKYGPPHGKPNQIIVELDDGTTAVYDCVG